MNKKIWYVISALSILIILATIAFWGMKGPEERERKIYQISYIYRSNTLDESQQAVKLGMEQAAKDYKLEITSVAFDNPGNPAEQIEMIEREVKNGADAIVIEPVKSKEVASILEKLQKKIPVVEVNSQAEEGKDGQIPSVHVDSYQMGEQLAKEIVKENENQKVILLKPGDAYTDVSQNYQGLYDTLEKEEIEIIEISFSAEDESQKRLPAVSAEYSGADAVVAFGTDELELTGKMWKEHPELLEVNIYGFGKSNQIIAYLEEGIISSIGVSNEYSAGYLSVDRVMNRLKGRKSSDKEVNFSIIDKEHIYTTDNQRLLFPFVQ